MPLPCTALKACPRRLGELLVGQGLLLEPLTPSLLGDAGAELVACPTPSASSEQCKYMAFSGIPDQRECFTAQGRQRRRLVCKQLLLGEGQHFYTCLYVHKCAHVVQTAGTAGQETKEIPTHSRVSLNLLNLSDICFQADRYTFSSSQLSKLFRHSMSGIGCIPLTPAFTHVSERRGQS